MKTYILQKDIQTPDSYVGKGAKFKKDDGDEYYYCYLNKYHQSRVKNNTEWFREEKSVSPQLHEYYRETIKTLMDDMNVKDLKISSLQDDVGSLRSQLVHIKRGQYTEEDMSVAFETGRYGFLRAPHIARECFYNFKDFIKTYDACKG